MQPRTTVQMDARTFALAKQTLERTIRASRKRHRRPPPCPSLPPEISFQLTWRCNLRCQDCFQWGDTGIFRTLAAREQQKELDIHVVERVLAETREAQSRVNLWGGEPLLYRSWEALAKLLAADPRPIVLCTNGLLLQQRMRSLLRISHHLLTVISMDGLRAENDANRGAGTFARARANLRALLNLRQQGDYQGGIMVNCVLTAQNIPTIYEFMEQCEALGVDRVVFSFPWYIAPATAASMDEYLRENFSWLTPLPPGREASWHHFTYRLAPEMLRLLRHELLRLNSRVWKVRIRLHPALEPREIRSMVLGRGGPRADAPRCLAVSQRLAILADGQVSACPTFREFGIGNIYTQGVKEIWQGERFQRVRQLMSRRAIPPGVCAKCSLLAGNEL